MDDKERFKLLDGPYRPPRVKPGDTVPCEVRGELTVHSWSDGRIPWPLAKNHAGGGLMYILFGDLARAIRTESNQSVVYWFGPSVTSVSKWRRALNVKRFNTGTKRVKRDWLDEKVPSEARKKGLALGHLITQGRKGRPAEHHHSKFPKRRWTPEEIALLGTMSDGAVANKIGCAAQTAGVYRRELGIPAFDQKIWRKQFANHITIDPAKLLARRLERNESQKVVGIRAGIPAYYEKLENGTHRHVRRKTLERLAEALGCKPDDLVLEDALAEITNEGAKEKTMAKQ